MKFRPTGCNTILRNVDDETGFDASISPQAGPLEVCKMSKYIRERAIFLVGKGPFSSETRPDNTLQ